MLKVCNLFKNFNKVKVLQDITFTVKKSQVFGLLGPNAAGKTTLMRCILGMLKPSSGSINYEGRPLDSEAIHSKFGFLPENFFPYKDFTGKEVLEIFASGLRSPKEEIERLTEEVKLSHHIHKRIHTYSRGLIQRLGISLSLLGEKEFLILDEPTLGLDPLGQRQMLELIKKLKAEGKTIFFSSHILSQVENICDEVGIINHGRLIFHGNIPQLFKDTKTSTLEKAFLSEIDRDLKCKNSSA